MPAKPQIAVADHSPEANRPKATVAAAVADEVVVVVAQTTNGPTVSVADDGPGVPAEERERIFEPFVRLPRSPRGGTGLGLAIVRRTIESHGGTITCDSCPAGGARFTLRLPAEP